MRVLHVSLTMSVEAGGPPVAVRGLARALADRGIESEIVTTSGGRYREPAPSMPGLSVRTFAASPLSSAWNGHSPSLARFVLTHIADFDIVHVHELWHHPGYVSTIAASRYGRPRVVSLRGGLDPVALGQKSARKRLYMKLVQGPMLRSAAAVHALTEAEAGQARALDVGVSPVVIPNGVDPGLSDGFGGADVPAFVRRHPTLAGKRVILFLGRLTANKGLDLLVRSFAVVKRRIEDAALLIVGPNKGDTRPRVQRLLDEARLLDSTVFTGALAGRDKLAALACADVFVLPSRAEGFSNAVLEAMAAGIPVVVSEQCNFPEVAESQAGRVVRNDVFQIANAISDYLRDDSKRRTAGAKGRSLVEERYSWPKVAAAFADLYQSVARSV